MLSIAIVPLSTENPNFELETIGLSKIFSNKFNLILSDSIHYSNQISISKSVI